MKRRLLALLVLVPLALLVLAPIAIIAYQLMHEPGSEERSAPVADRQAQIARGAYLARAGNCAACHTLRGGSAYAGGRAIATPFGDIYSSNITPDRATGIGAWSADDFWRALHNGKSRDGGFLYPAFPYPNTTRITRADTDALYAYLQTVAPVRQENRAHALRFPYNQRLLLAFWRALYFRAGVFQPQPGQSAEWNRGAYLVQGPGHCGACHTARDFLGGTAERGDLAGGMIPMLNWYASPLTSDAASGLGAWSSRDIAQLLKTGVSARGAVFGPMAEVVGASLQHLSSEDIDAMALYLKSLPAELETAAPAEPPAAARSLLQAGAQLYEHHCANCHGADGRGAPPAYPPLAGSRALAMALPVNPIRIVLNGGFPPVTAGNPRPYGMPPFGTALNDGEVAALLSYVRNSWGNRAGFVTADDVAHSRGAPIE
jgi:mono/diheme cytochrome c family protein